MDYFKIILSLFLSLRHDQVTLWHSKRLAAEGLLLFSALELRLISLSHVCF